MKILKSQPIKHRANERQAAAATLLARSCFIVSIQLNLLLNFSLSSFCARGIHAPKNECRHTCSGRSQSFITLPAGTSQA
jgi:hypothetical protein